jgi:HlyD family secretion protein
MRSKQPTTRHGAHEPTEETSLPRAVRLVSVEARSCAFDAVPPTRSTAQHFQPPGVSRLFQAPGRQPIRATTAKARSARIARRVVSGAVALAVCVGLYIRFADTAAQPAVHYTTANCERGAIYARVIGTGVLSAVGTVSVGTPVSGRIESLRADYGEHVKKGEVIATLEPSAFRLAVAQANAELAAAVAGLQSAKAREMSAETAFESARDLNAEGFLPGAEYEQARANLTFSRADSVAGRASVKRARAALDRAALDLKNTTIVAPIDGVVISRDVNVGEPVATGPAVPTLLFTLAEDLTRMQLDTPVAERDVGNLRVGMPVTFTVAAQPSRRFAGSVRQIRDEPRRRFDVVTYDAIVDVENVDRVLKPGMTASVTFPYAERAAALRIPTSALNFEPDRSVLALMTDAGTAAPRQADERTVWVLRREQALPVSIRIGIADGAWTEVTGGDIQPGDRAIVGATLNAEPIP